MMVTTEMTAATPTTMPIKVSAVRSLLARKLAVATRNASQMCWPRKSILPFAALLDSLVFFDLTVANRDHAVCAYRNVVFVRNHDDRVAFGVETLEEVHDLHAGM
jgi:hypothetical protein